MSLAEPYASIAEKNRIAPDGYILDGPPAREWSAHHTAEVLTARAYLLAAYRCKATHSRAAHSYSTKHAAELWGGLVGMEPYVSNGAVIVAALAIGIDVERCGVNAVLGVLSSEANHGR